MPLKGKCLVLIFALVHMGKNVHYALLALVDMTEVRTKAHHHSTALTRCDEIDSTAESVTEPSPMVRTGPMGTGPVDEVRVTNF